MGNINKKEKILLLVVLIACVAFLYIQLYLPKQTAKIDALNSNISDYKSKLDSLNLTSLTNIKLRKELDELELKYKKTIAAFPKEGRVPEIANNFDVYSRNNNITLSNMTVGDVQEFSQNSDKNDKNSSAKGASKTDNKTDNKTDGKTDSKSNNKTATAANPAFKLFIIPTTLSVTGEYLKVNSFLATIEKDARHAKIDQITIKNSSNGKVTADLSTNYYYVPGIVISTEYPFNNGIKNKEDMFKE